MFRRSLVKNCSALHRTENTRFHEECKATLQISRKGGASGTAMVMEGDRLVVLHRQPVDGSGTGIVAAAAACAVGEGYRWDGFYDFEIPCP